MLSDPPRDNAEPPSSSVEHQINEPATPRKDHDTDVTISEETPLLRSSSRPSSKQLFIKSEPISTRWIVIVLLLLGILLQAGDQLMQIPLARVYESIYCYEYWEEHDPSKLLAGRADAGPGAIRGVEEALCKVPEIQSQVAALVGNLDFFNGIPSLVLAIPFGMLADTWGRKPVCLMGLVSFPCAAAWICLVCWFWQILDIRLIWLSALHGICGGSATVVSAMFMTIISDIVPEESRASVYFSISSAGLAMKFMIPPLAAALMAIQPWIPIFAGILLQTIPITLMVFVPETLRHEKTPVANLEPSTVVSSQGSAWFEPLRDIWNMLRKDWRVTGLTTTFLLHMYTMYSGTLLLVQYVSTRYVTTFSQATFIVSLRSGFTMVIFLALMPWLSHLLITKWGYSAKKKDLVLSRASAIVASVGWLLVSLAPNISFFVFAIFVCTLGAGLFTFVRSFLTSIVSPDHVAKLFTFMSVLDTIGMMGAGPFFAWLFKIGLHIGGAGPGLPFMVLGGVYAACSGLMFCIRIKRDDRGELKEEQLAEPLVTAA